VTLVAELAAREFRAIERPFDHRDIMQMARERIAYHEAKAREEEARRESA